MLRRGTHPKCRRPLDSKLPVHLVLRAEHSRVRLPKFFGRVDAIVRETANKHGVRLYKFANVGNHCHLLLKFPNRDAWAAFIRELTGRLARLTGARWTNRPFTRVIGGWRKAYRLVKRYVRLNTWEAERRLTRAESLSMRDLMRQMGFSDPF